jgi:hypothetical protein
MKRPDTGRAVRRSGDIRRDFTRVQLAGIASVALAYNEAERSIDTILGLALSLGNISNDVIGRINGVEGKVELTKLALREIGCPQPIRDSIAHTLGDAGFMLLKKFRDRIIHTSMVDTAAAIARSPANRGTFEEVLITVEGLEALYRRIELLRLELDEITKISAQLLLLNSQQNETLNLVSGRGVPKEQIESEIQACFARYQAHQKDRLSLPPLPAFPEESELRATDEKALQARQDDTLKRLRSLMNPPRKVFLHEIGRQGGPLE